MLVLKHRSGGVSRGNFCGKGKAYRSTFSCRVGRHILMAETHHKDKLLSARCTFGGPAAPWIGLLAITWIPSSLWGEASAFWPVHINSSLGDFLTLRIIQAGKLMSGETCMISKSEELEHFFFFFLYQRTRKRQNVSVPWDIEPTGIEKFYSCPLWPTGYR